MKTKWEVYLETIEAHHEDYDRDCETHDGCTCGWSHPGPDIYTPDTESNEAKWPLHFAEKLQEALHAAECDE